jgi:hypothetical protein
MYIYESCVFTYFNFKKDSKRAALLHAKSGIRHAGKFLEEKKFFFLKLIL